MNDVPFALLTRTLDRITNANTPTEKKKILESFWVHVYENDPSRNLFPVMRLLLPSLDTGRTYGLREKKLAMLYIKALGLHPQRSEDAIYLQKWKTPRGQGQVSGDFSAVLLDVLARRGVEEPLAAAAAEGPGVPTVGTVNAILTRLATVGEHADASQLAIVRMLLARFRPVEQMWIVRMILKDLKMGIGPDSMLRLFHVDAEGIYNATSSLEEVCTVIATPRGSGANPSDGSASSATSGSLLATSAQLMKGFQPMLCNRQPWDSMCATMRRTFVVQDKLDGERIVVHKRGTELKLFTRSGRGSYGDEYKYDRIFRPVRHNADEVHEGGYTNIACKNMSVRIFVLSFPLCILTAQSSTPSLSLTLL